MTKKDELVLAFYKPYLDDLAQIGDHHETIRAFYLTLVTTVFGFLTLTGKDGLLENLPRLVLGLVALVGIAICVLWFFHMLSFSQIFTAKFEVLRELEERVRLDVKPFKLEHEILEKEREFNLFKTKSKRIHITMVDRALAAVFGVFYVALWCLKHLL
jgi:predicted RND superfamily exporter protein